MEIERTPIHNPHPPVKRLLKNNSCQSLRIIHNLRLDVEVNRYKPALIYLKEKREFVPTLVEVYDLYRNFFIVRRKCYNPDGEFRQYLYSSVSYIDLMIGECRIQFFEGDI